MLRRFEGAETGVEEGKKALTKCRKKALILISNPGSKGRLFKPARPQICKFIDAPINGKQRRHGDIEQSGRESHHRSTGVCQFLRGF